LQTPRHSVRDRTNGHVSPNRSKLSDEAVVAWSLGDVYWRNAAQIVATSEMEQQELVDDGVPAEKVVIRYNGIDGCASGDRPLRGAFRTKWGIPPEEPLVLFLGRLIPRKGADILIEAFSESLPEISRLVIAGPEGEA